jgi:hypothetical protein
VHLLPSESSHAPSELKLLLNEDTWNFDETGFQMGVIATARVVTGTDRAGRPRTIEQAIENGSQSLNVSMRLGGSISPLVISEAVMHQAAWYEDDTIPHDWSIGVSDNGWTTNEIGLTWLNLFHEHTKDHTVGTHRLGLHTT